MKPRMLCAIICAKLEADPGRLEEVESRLAALEKLKRKYGATVEEVLAFLANVRAELAAVEHSSERRDALRKQTAALSSAYESAAAKAERGAPDRSPPIGANASRSNSARSPWKKPGS